MSNQFDINLRVGDIVVLMEDNQVWVANLDELDVVLVLDLETGTMITSYGLPKLPESIPKLLDIVRELYDTEVRLQEK